MTDTHFTNKPTHLVENEAQDRIRHLKGKLKAKNVEDTGTPLDFELPEDKRSGIFQVRKDRMQTYQTRIDGLTAQLRAAEKVAAAPVAAVEPQGLEETPAAETAKTKGRTRH